MQTKILSLCTLLMALGIQGQNEKETVDRLLDQWHLAASRADFDGYFGPMARDATYLGTDASENWKVEAFKAFAKPYFDQGKGWTFQAVERNIYVAESGKFAWFDELLDSPHMKFCRGSGLLKKENGQWKIAHYVLSIVVPNALVDEVVKIKTPMDDSLLRELRDR